MSRWNLHPQTEKNKQIGLTDSGNALVAEKILPLVQAEERSFERLNEEERSRLLAITQKHSRVIEEEIEKL